MTSFWRNNDVVITSCVQGERHTARHFMKTPWHENAFCIAGCPLVRGIYRSPVDSHHHGPVMQIMSPLLLGQVRLWFESHVALVTSLQCSPTVILIRIFLWLGLNGTIGYLEARVNDTAVTVEHQSHSVARWCQRAWESFAAVFKVPDVRWFRAVVKCQTVITAVADCLKVKSLLCQFNKLK